MAWDVLSRDVLSYIRKKFAKSTDNKRAWNITQEAKSYTEILQVTKACKLHSMPTFSGESLTYKLLLNHEICHKIKIGYKLRKLEQFENQNSDVY